MLDAMRWAVWLVVIGATVAGVLACAVVVVIAALFAVCHVRRKRDGAGRRSVTVLVLGDFGRSPRMQYVSVHPLAVRLIHLLSNYFHIV